MTLGGIPAAILVWFGRARVQHGDHHCETDHGLLLEFKDTRSLQEAVNTGSAKFGQGDDTVATVLVQGARR